MIKSKKCKISGCENERYANTSWCYSHYIEHEKEKKAKKEAKAIAKLNDKIKKQAQKDLWRIVHNRVWKLMSEYIRTKDADEFGYNTCYTCGARKHWKELQCGHYKHDKLDFDERNLKPQCYRDNNFLSGRLDVYTVNLIRDYGMDWLNKLSEDAQKASKGKDSYSIEEMLEIEKDLKAKLEVIRKRIN